MFKIGFRLSKYVIEVLELRFFFLNTQSCFHAQKIKFSPVSLRPRSSWMHSYVLTNRQKHFVSHMFALLQRWFFRTQFIFKLHRCKLSSLLHGLGHKSWQLYYFVDICERICICVVWNVCRHSVYAEQQMALW